MTRQSNKRPATDYGAGHGKLPPQAVDVEEAVLGALIIEGKSIIDVADVLTPGSFYKEAHIRIYEAISYLFQHSEPIDLLTVTSRLRTTQELELIGGGAYLMGLTTKVNSSANIEHHARIISEMHMKRELIKIASEIQNDAFDDSSDAFELLDRIEQRVFGMTQANVKKNYVTMSKAVDQSIKEMDKRGKSDDKMPGVPSGFPSLDQLTAGFQRGELYILAARPAQGKTALSLSLARNASIDFNMPVGIFSLEMGTTQITNRMISAQCEIEAEKIRRGTLSIDEWEKLHKRISPLSNAKVLIDDSGSLSVLELRSKARRMKHDHDVQMIIIDYLQLMTSSSNGKTKGTREQEISYISMELKNLAKDLNVAVIALSQLSRSVEQRGGDKRPLLADLKDSGGIEAAGDAVIFLHRPEYYGITQDEAGNSLFGVGELIVAKNRNGSLGTSILHFSGKYTKFENPNAPNTQSEIKFEAPVSLDKPVESFTVAKQSALFDYQPTDQDPDF